MNFPQFLRAQANLLRLERFTDDIIVRFTEYADAFRLTEDLLCRINGIVCDGLDENKNPGQLRRVNVKIINSDHRPPPWQEVPKQVREFCNEFNKKWDTADLIELAALALWRTNWIHPFENGNGRTSRQLCYIVLCLKSGGHLPGRRTVIVQLQERRIDYQEALRESDSGNYAPLEQLLNQCLVNQLRNS